MHITACRFRCCLHPGLLAFLLPASIPCGFAETVFKWDDPGGTTHFSQTPPPGGTTEIEVIELDAVRPALPAADNYYSIVNQARRMEEDRRKREQENLDRRLAIQRAQQNGYRKAETHSSDTTYIPVYSYYGRKHPYYTRHHRGKAGLRHAPGFRSGAEKHRKPAPYRNTQRRGYPRGVINTGR